MRARFQRISKTRAYRHMNGFGSHTYSFYTPEGTRHGVKFHFRSQQGLTAFTDGQAADIVAGDREHSQRDLFEAMEKGDFPTWTMFVQVMPV